MSGSRSEVVAIVPTFNRAPLLRSAIASIRAQSLQPDRILVVDDGSTDETAQMVADLEGVDYLRQANAGKAAALNFALQRVGEPLVWIFDDDDLAAPDALEKLWGALNARPDCGLAYGRYDKFRVDSSSGEHVQQGAGAPDPPEQDLLAALLERCFLFQGAMLVRRRCYDEVGPFDQRLIRSQDYDMLLRLVERFPAVRVPHIIFHQREHDGVRGSTQHNIVSADRDRAWRAYDTLVMDKVKARLQKSAFCPASALPGLGARWRSGADLRRFVVFARKAMWPDAVEALEAFSLAARSEGRQRLERQERAALGRVFDGWSYAWLEEPPLRRLRTALDAIAAPRLRFEFKVALTGSNLERVFNLVRRPDRRGLARAISGAWATGGPFSFPVALATIFVAQVARAAAAVRRRGLLARISLPAT